MENANKFREKIHRGEVSLGTTITFVDSTVTEALCSLLDFVWIDMEHNALSLETVQAHLMATKGSNTTSLVRVPWNDPVLIKPVLDIGADGVIVPLWHRAAALKLVVSVYAGTEHLATVAALAERFPDVPILLDHMAHPDVAGGVKAATFQTLLDLERFPRLAVKVSGYSYYSGQGYPYTDCAELFRALYDRFGPTRLIWGSDFPHVLLKIGYRRSLLFQQRAYPFLSQADLDLIMGGNAAELYWS